jgi:hypothetical protein
LRLAHNFIKRHIDAIHLGATHARQTQQIGDQLVHAIGGFLDRLHAGTFRLVQAREAAALEDFRKRGDVAQRRAQIVRDRVSERLEFALSGLQRPCALRQKLLELGVHLAQMFKLLAHVRSLSGLPSLEHVVHTSSTTSTMMRERATRELA